MALVKKKVDVKNPVETEYTSLLTPYAYLFVSKQLALKHKVGIILESDAACQVSTSEGIFKATAESCECRFRATTQWPCRHMFAVMDKKQLPLFAPDTVAKRWTLEHMKEVFDNKTDEVNADSFQVCNYMNNVV